MKVNRSRWFTMIIASTILCVVCFAVGSCRDHATAGDKEAIARLQRTWGSKYDFTLTSQIYWKTRLKPNVPFNEDELKLLFDKFTAGRNPNVSAYVYMNIYDARGRFIVQF